MELLKDGSVSSNPQVSQMLESNQGFNVAIRVIVSKVKQQQMSQCMEISTEQKFSLGGLTS